MVKSPKSRGSDWLYQHNGKRDRPPFFHSPAPLNKTKSGEMSPKTYRTPWKSDTWKTMGSLPFWIGPLFWGAFLATIRWGGFQDRPSQRLQCSSFPFWVSFGSLWRVLSKHQGTSVEFMFVFEVFFCKKSWNFRPIYQFDLPPLQSFYQHSFASPQKPTVFFLA